MSASHTPGPWEIEDEYVQQAGKPDVGLCSVLNMDVGGDKGWYRGPTTEANARLMAAAPDLLAVAKRMLDFALDGGDFAYPLGSLYELEQAVAKAEGSQHG